MYIFTPNVLNILSTVASFSKENLCHRPVQSHQSAVSVHDGSPQHIVVIGISKPKQTVDTGRWCLVLHDLMFPLHVAKGLCATSILVSSQIYRPPLFISP